MSMETTLWLDNEWLNEFAYKSSAKGWGNVHQVCILKTKMLIWEKLGEQRKTGTKQETGSAETSGTENTLQNKSP